MPASLKERFHNILSNVDFCSLRYVEEHTETLAVRQDIIQPPLNTHSVGVMITVIDNNGIGYAATSDLSESGLRQAFTRAHHWTKNTDKHTIVPFSEITLPKPQGTYFPPIEKTWDSLSTTDKLALLHHESAQSKLNTRIVDWRASLQSRHLEQLYLTGEGGEVYQCHHYLIPHLSVTAHQGTDTQYRSYTNAQQGGLEILDHIHFSGRSKQLAQEAIQLLTAPNCPTEHMDLMLSPDQMILQIHESIGHPLELDRILGDERNYAGTSFVTLDMFGNYRYGSELLNVTYDPTYYQQIASYGFDDEGLTAQKTYIIRDGILINPLGGTISQARARLPGVANARATHWNRPPIDRMANLNIEPGRSSLKDMISSIERGIFMRTNLSWSIDDSRNKFQFGCEWGQLIENGELTHLVKNPNYRGISATFWRSLKHVGNIDTFEVLGVPTCGKGEPNQIIHVGHASPTCVFTNVNVFGGA